MTYNLIPVNGHLFVTIKVGFVLLICIFFGLFANQTFLINSVPK